MNKQYQLYKIKSCRCPDNSHWKEYVVRGLFVPKSIHYEIHFIECQYCNVKVAEQEIILHQGFSEYCDSCNYWAYGKESPLDFASIYNEFQITDCLECRD